MLPLLLLFSGCLSLRHESLASGQRLTTIHQWKWVDYLWDSEADRTAAIKTGDYNYTKSIIIDSDVAKDGRVFVTVIRGIGVPASLSTVSNRTGNGGPLLKPYPDWSWAKKGDCNSISSVYRIAIDACNRLWVIDNGKIGGKQVCPPQLLAFDLETDTLLKRVPIPDDAAYNSKTGEGLLITPIVETEGPHCQRTYVYIADVQGNALVVYNGTSLWRLESSVYAPQESAANAEIAGQTFNLPDGVIGMALSPKKDREPRFLAFRAFASYDMVLAKTRNLQDSYSNAPVNYTIGAGVLPSQAVAMAFSSHGTLFFGLTNETALACWNIDNSLTKENIVVVDQNRITHQFASGLKVIPKQITGGSEQILMVTNRYQKIASGSQDFGEVNFRIMTGCVDDLITDTKCAPRSHNGNNNHHHHHHHHRHHRHGHSTREPRFTNQALSNSPVNQKHVSFS